MKQNSRNREQGIILISTLFLIVALLGMIGAHHLITMVELATTKSTSNSAKGFSASEAGLNLRAEEIRASFLDYNRPEGTTPTAGNECEGANNGAGSFACQTKTFGTHTSKTYVEESPSNPIITTIPLGELYQNLNAQEYRYTVHSTAKNSQNRVEAILDMRFKSRLVPLFQFVAFYNKDLEILPGPTMNLNGPVHTNGDLYMNSGAQLRISGQVTTAGDLYRGRKNDTTCLSNPVQVMNPATFTSILPSCPTRTKMLQSQLTAWNGMIQTNVDELIVPEPGMLNAGPGYTYFDKADLRIALRVNSSGNPVTTYASSGVEVRRDDNTVYTSRTNNLNSCTGQIAGNTKAVGSTNTFRNNRENKTIRMLEIDLTALFNCIQTFNTNGNSFPIMGGKALNDSTEGGLVIHLTVDGPNSGNPANNYGVRIRNGQQLRSTNGGAPTIKGLTVVTDQGFYIHGNYNSVNKKPAAFLVDSFNVLSTNWNLNDAASTNTNLGTRVAANTIINAAVLAGTDSTGSIEGTGGQSIGEYNGGLENYPRFHERWTGMTLTYRGSLVSLSTPSHVNGDWVYGSPQYEAPNRDWDYDTNFNDAANLPPMTPRFVYLRQELFVRDFEQ